MLTLYLIRHGETEWNKGSVYQGHTDVPLSGLGLRQAAAVARRLADEPLDAVYSSDLGRARQTAETVAAAQAQVQRNGGGNGNGLDRPVPPVICAPELREIDVGLCAGKTRTESELAFPDVFRAMRTDPAGTRMPGGESFADLYERVSRAVMGIAAARPEGKLALVSHGGSIRAVLCLALGMPLNRRSRLAVDNCSISVVTFDQGAWQAATINDTCHLDGLDTTASVEV